MFTSENAYTKFTYACCKTHTKYMCTSRNARYNAYAKFDYAYHNAYAKFDYARYNAYAKFDYACHNAYAKFDYARYNAYANKIIHATRATLQFLYML